MRIERVKYGFIQYCDNKVIEKITCYEYLVKERTKSIRIGDEIGAIYQETSYVCTVHFHDRPPKELNNICCGVYNSQYGIPISEDGSKLFVGSWEWNKGLQAYDIETGTMLWKLKQGKIRDVFVYQDYLIALKANTAVYKISIDSGEVLGQIKGGMNLESLYDLGSQYVLADTLSGKISVIDTDKMLIVKKYSNKTVNPLNGNTFVIREVTLNDNVLSISGFESISETESRRFNRIIDTDFQATGT